MRMGIVPAEVPENVSPARRPGIRKAEMILHGRKKGWPPEAISLWRKVFLPARQKICRGNDRSKPSDLHQTSPQNRPISLAMWKAAEVAAVIFRGATQSPMG